ncbi:MAG: HK97 gp10 family phage protein, partial [Salinibacterium sp.]
MIPTIEIDKRELDRFQGALGKMIAIAGEKASLVVRKVAFDLLRDIIRATPVDTGRARAGWTAWFDSTGASMPLGGSSS